MLCFDGARTAALVQSGFLVFNFGKQIHHVARVCREICRFAVDASFKERIGQTQTSQQSDNATQWRTKCSVYLVYSFLRVTDIV